MANIVDTIYYTYIKQYRTQYLILFLLFIFMLATYFAYIWYIENKLQKKKTDDIANANRRGKNAELYFFSVDWCPHCKTAKPEWAKFVADYDGNEINGFIIKCNTINATNDEDPEISTLVQKFGVEHYPTLKMVVDEKIIEFQGKIVEASLVKFITAMAV